MNNRSRTEKEIIVSLNSMSLDEIFLNSSGSAEQINGILMKLLNKYHTHVARKSSTCCPILASSAAA